MKLEFQEYKTRKIVNVHKHVDSWFWDKYSAHPYIGCRSGCDFCYCRGGYYLRKRAPETLDTLIQVKIKAVDLPTVKLGRSRYVEIGDAVYVLGNPLGLTNTLADGLISAIRKGDGFQYFQITAPISPGSSGGPVIDSQGPQELFVEGF